MQDLVPIDKTTVLQAFTTGEGMDDFIDSVRSAALALTDTEKATLDTQVGRSQYASAAAKVARVKTRADTIGKDSIAEAKALIKKVDGNRRYLRERLDDIKAQVRRPLTQWEEQQKAIMEELRGEIERYERLGEEFSSPGHSLDDIEAALGEVEAWTITEEVFGELEIDALKAQRKASQLLGVVLAAERDRLRIEAEEARQAAERAAKEREEKLKREAEEAKRRAEQLEEARIAAEKRAEEERAAADRRIQEAQEAAERREREMKAEAMRKAEEQRKAEDLRRKREKAEQEAEKQRKAEAAALLDKHIAEAVESIVNAVPKISPIFGEILVQKIIAGDIKHIKFEQQQ
jgi:hypothetical protein